ncbi:RAB6A-GEF complex partner protein 2 [Psilocybe cubensis]|uniref:Rgp1-domain-containing protein n=2 Tax=Psilocybe cubensis TaxID=181762 RepID=A0A8H7Y987_PSICU|nr:RAB6A-GEF complex partner protein 2 [Psilocybe cubensis]KAH9487327.1 RAB6A-GEF complex partner protein 2 [Psilocybe cubensis]
MPGITSTNDADSPVRIVVTPSQSSFFAGESFSVTITFTNTRSTEAGPSKPTPHSHKRGAHSISSAPLARPPTSPGTPRSAAIHTPVRSKVVEEVPRRKGFIGKGKPLSSSETLPDLIEQRRKKQLVPKALSVSITPFELEGQLADGVTSLSAPYSQRSFIQSASSSTPTTPHVSSPLARTDSLPLASNHPHARKQSLLDGQFSLDVLSPTTSTPPLPYTPTSSTSTFSLALDPIAEATMSPYPSTPAIGSPTIEPVSFTPHTPTADVPSPNSVYAYPPPRPTNHRPTPIGLGQPSNSPRGYLHPPRSAFATTFPPPNTELILYSYAQLSGTIQITPVPGALPTPEQSQTLNAVRGALLSRSVLGGGSMDITSTMSATSPASPKPRLRQTHSRSSSFSAGLLSILSPTSLVSSIASPSPPASATHSRSGSMRWRSTSSTAMPLAATPTSARFPNSSSSPSVLAFGNTSGQEFDPEEPLPTFEIQPAMLAVDLSLAPGESRSYTYTVKLPDNLPPTFKGKALKFNYELIVGTCRAGPSGGSGGGVSANSISRVMKVPVRIYNHVAVGHSMKPYDLLWPVSRRQDAGMPGTEAKVEEEGNELDRLSSGVARLPASSTPSSSASTNTRESIQEYARSLLASLPEPVPQEDGGSSWSSTDGVLDGQGEKMINTRRAEELRRTESERERVEEVNLTGCREAVEILTRNPKKASYDVNKDGVKVAVLTFTKSAYRLGETVTGVVEINERTSRARVLKLSAILESHETLPSTISPPSSAKHLRRAHAESHCSFTLNTLRTTFSLDIPSDASPAFQVRVGTPVSSPSSPHHTQPPTPGGLEWKVRLCLLVGIASETSHTGVQNVRFKSLMRDGPRGEWGSSWRATPGNAPLEKPNLKLEAARAQQQQRAAQQLSSPRAWSRFIVSSILYGSQSNDTAEREYHDGDVLDTDEEDGDLFSGDADGDGYDGIIPDLAGGVGVGVDFSGGEEGWRNVKLETVECEVPVKVFPGNTAFKALDVVFDV